MSYTMKKAVVEIITVLKKIPEPGKKTGSFWDFMKSKLAEEGEWEQKHIKTIEKEIDGFLSKLDKKSLLDMWTETPAASEKNVDEKKLDTKTIKTDVADELLGQVMDRMDDNYSSRDSFFTSSEPIYSEQKKDEEEESFNEEKEPDEITDEEIDFDDEDLFNEENDDDDDYRI
jgi:hypothetical protein